MKPVFYTDKENYQEFLKLKEKADNGHEGAKKLCDKLKQKYDKPGYVFIEEKWYKESLRVKAQQLKQYRIMMKYKHVRYSEKIKKEFDKIKKVCGEEDAKLIIWMLYRKRM